MMISLLIANLHAAVFYVFFILLLPYFAEYICVCSDKYFVYRFKMYNLKRRIKRLVKKEASAEKLEKLQAKLEKLEENFVSHKEVSQNRKKNPYKIKMLKRENVKWLFLIAIFCLAMGLLTPIGDEPYTHIFKLFSGDTTQNISEHQPLVLATNVNAIASMIVLFGLLIFTDAKASLKDLFMLGGLILLTFMSQRQFSLLTAIGVISLTSIVCSLLEIHGKERYK